MENKFPMEEGFEYIAVSKIDGSIHKDYLNKGGSLSAYLKEKNIGIPSGYERKKYFTSTGDYWHEQWFDIKRVAKIDKVSRGNELSPSDIEELCRDYKDGGTINSYASKYHVGKSKIRKALEENGVAIKKVGGQGEKTPNERHKPYEHHDGFHYIAVLKDDNTIKFDDYLNAGGYLTSFIRDVLGIDVPSLYERKKYLNETGNYWYEQWFDIVEVHDGAMKKCPYCEWMTCDTENRSGAFELHLKREHGMGIEDYLKDYPEDINYFNVYRKNLERKDGLAKNEDYVVCPICGEKMRKITLSHLMMRHSMTYEDFKEKYPTYAITSDSMREKQVEILKEANMESGKSSYISRYEVDLHNFLTENGIEFESNRQMLIGKEIDILIPEKKIGIEFDGLKYHTEEFGHKDSKYHLTKTVQCNEKGYALIHIFEDEYVNSKAIVYSKLRHILGLDADLPKVMGRKCCVREIYKVDAENFLNRFHIQGFVSASVYYGAFYNDELVAVMSFKKGNVKNKDWELVRFATDDRYCYQGIGGKLFKHFLRIYKPSRVVSFADRRWTLNSDNNLYTKLGFALDTITKPDYRYYNDRVDKYKRVHKMTMSKQSLHNKYGFPLTMTEREMTRKLGYDKIWDCGLFKYVWKEDSRD